MIYDHIELNESTNYNNYNFRWFGSLRFTIITQINVLIWISIALNFIIAWIQKQLRIKLLKYYANFIIQNNQQTN